MTSKSTNPDPVVEEIHRVREAILSRFNGDLHAVVEDMRRREATSDHPIWQGPAGATQTESDKEPVGVE